MRNLIFLAIVTLVTSCSPQKPISGGGVSSNPEVKKQGSKMCGKVVVKSKMSLDGKSEMPVLYFDINGVEYFIDFSASKVAKVDIQKYILKEIDILGEIKTEGFSVAQGQSRVEQEEAKKYEGNAIVIYKVMD